MSGMERDEWLRSFHRMNLMDGTVWSAEEADAKVPIVLECMLMAPVTVVLGHQVREFLSLPKVPWILPQRADLGFSWRLLPHPSGRTQTYNDPIFRATVRVLLQELAR